MTTTAGPDIIPREAASLPALLAADQGVADALESVLSENTRRVYGAQWRIFNDWCGDVGLRALPAGPLTVARYLAARAGDGASIATLRLAASAIAKAHELAGYESPGRDQGVRASLKGWGRRLARPQRQAGALTADVLSVIRLTAPKPRGPRPRLRNASAGRPARPLRPGPGGRAVGRGVAPVRSRRPHLERCHALGRRQRPHHCHPLQDRRRSPGRRGGHYTHRNESFERHPAGRCWW